MGIQLGRGHAKVRQGYRMEMLSICRVFILGQTDRLSICVTRAEL